MLTYQLAYKLTSSERFSLEDFYKNGTCNEYLSYWPHYNFFYSYPEFGKKFCNHEGGMFHRVKTVCHLCKCSTERNHAGIGSFHLLHNGISDETITVKTGKELIRGRVKFHYSEIANTPRLSPFIILCHNCVGSYFKYEKNKPKPVLNKQLVLEF